MRLVVLIGANFHKRDIVRLDPPTLLSLKCRRIS